MASAREHKNTKNRIRLSLGKRPDVVIWNNESGVARYGHQSVRYGVGKGGSDLIGIVETGRLIALEVKTGKARLTKEQTLFLKLVIKMGGHAAVVRSVEDANREVDSALHKARGVQDN